MTRRLIVFHLTPGLRMARAAFAAGSSLAKAIISPMANKVGSRAEPPYENSGSGTPAIGNRPSTAPILITACAVIQVVTPPAAYLTKGSSVRPATRIPA